MNFSSFQELTHKSPFPLIKEISPVKGIWSHLKHIHLPQVDEEIELLIGTNVPKALEPLEVVCSANDGPYAVRTLLGWMVNGPLERLLTASNHKYRSTEFQL